jgi:very-short-patch-repair endonuclease
VSGPSAGEAEFDLHCRAVLPRQLLPVRQHPLLYGRGWRLDFAWPDRMLAVEIDGAVHRIKGRFRSDIERHNVLALLGWRVLRFSPSDVSSGKAIDVLRAVLVDADGSAALVAAQRKDRR